MINGYDLGANSYVCKPIKFDEFAAAVAQLGVYWLLINEPPPQPAVASEHTGDDLAIHVSTRDNVSD